MSSLAAAHWVYIQNELFPEAVTEFSTIDKVDSLVYLYIQINAMSTVVEWRNMNLLID